MSGGFQHDGAAHAGAHGTRTPPGTGGVRAGSPGTGSRPATGGSEDAAHEAPLFSVVRGNPDDAELAALAAVLLSLRHDDDSGTVEPSRRDVLRRQIRRRSQLAGLPGSWRSGRF